MTKNKFSSKMSVSMRVSFGTNLPHGVDFLLATGVRFSRNNSAQNGLRCVTQSKQSFEWRFYLDHFDRVPDHFILGVLWYLNKYDLTNTMNACRRFKYIGYARRSYLYVNAISTSKFRVDPKLWKFLNLQGRPISESALHTIIDRKIRILRLFSSSVYCLKL